MLQKDQPVKVVIRGLPGQKDVEAKLRALQFPIIKCARITPKPESKNVKINNKTPIPPKPKVLNITRTQPTFTSRLVTDSRAYSDVLRKGNESKQVSHAPRPMIAQEPLPCANTNRPAPAVTKRANSDCSLSEIFQCLMDLANQNPSHSHIIQRAFGLAKNKMRSSHDKFDMSYHLFEAYTHVISNNEFCTA
ncbi:hypothetical protein CDAR_517571 [Caerostris darwini]|uniref:Uncharacterized protein n=1 Tax=Caerostris darwini TaxID=1538125 RepID=A0AAV4PKC7_9ARAC|nr:hypothetical protein CDAR_517571 [Caerostris darwini]